jgi:hypothetical protein
VHGDDFAARGTKVFADERVEVCVLPTADGITLAWKR